MDLSPWATAGQLALSIATASIAFAVYRVQADKLFLEMREKRIAAIDGYRDAIKARLDQVSGINRVNLEQQLNAGDLEPPMRVQWTAELEIKRWFGDEVVELMPSTDRAVAEAMRVKIEWCSAERGQAGSYDRVNEAHLAGFAALETVLNAANPYVRAERRGLPIKAGWRVWRSRRPRSEPIAGPARDCSALARHFAETCHASP